MAIIQTRRSLLTGLGASLIAAPAIVRAESLMPVHGPKLITYGEYLRRVLKPATERLRRESQLFTDDLIAAIRNGDRDAVVLAGDPLGKELVRQGVLRSIGAGPSGFVEWRLPTHVVDQ